MANRYSALGRDFWRVFSGRVAGNLGGQMGDVALRILFASTLAAGALELGILSAAQTAGFLIFGLPAGLIVDRVSRRRLLIISDIARAALLALIPIAAILGWLNIYLVIAIVFLVGLGNLLFEISFKSLLPALVPNDKLVLANTRLETGRTSAALTGPIIAGALVQWLTAPAVILIQSISYIISALRIKSIRTAHTTSETKKPFALSEIKAGLNLIARDRRLKALTGAAATYNFGYGLLTPLLVLLLIVEYGASPGAVGLVYAFSGIGGVLGAFSAQKILKHIPLPRAIVMAELVAPLAAILYVIATPNSMLVLVAIGNLILHFALAVYNITSVSLSQLLCPPAVLGRVKATIGFFASGTLPLGALLGGVIGEMFGAQIGLIAVCLAFAAAAFWLVISPIPKMSLPG